MSPSEWTSQRNWRWTTVLSQKDAFEFPLQVVLILVGLLPTSTNTLSVGDIKTMCAISFISFFVYTEIASQN